MKTTDSYFERFGFCERQIAAPPPEDLGLVVVIPCFNEPDLPGCLDSLWACDRPACTVEVIVVINSSRTCAEEILAQNQETLSLASAWTAHHIDSRFAFHLLHFPDLPMRQAGVGLARKIGMDEAVRRLDDVGRPDGIVVCYDADCRCEGNYLTSIERYFQEHSRSPGCSIYFEHPLEGPLDTPVYEAITAYELHLRYYVQGLRFAGFPYAHHTMGSCMAVRARIYTKQGGMNKRKAGEDFYFLQKIIPLGGFSDLTATKVVPSPRSSSRVPFGTGKAVLASLHQEAGRTYPWEAFLNLKSLFDRIPLLYRDNGLPFGGAGTGLSEAMRDYLQRQEFARAVTEIRQNTSTEAAFRKRFFHWFNAFRVMKFVHHARNHFYGERKIEEEAKRLLHLLLGTSTPCVNFSLRELLKIYRALDVGKAATGWR